MIVLLAWLWERDIRFEARCWSNSFSIATILFALGDAHSIIESSLLLPELSQLYISMMHRAVERFASSARVPPSKTSMLQDMENGNPLELDGILAATIEVADLLHVSVPLTRTVYGLLRVRDQVARINAAGGKASP